MYALRGHVHLNRIDGEPWLHLTGSSVVHIPLAKSHFDIARNLLIYSIKLRTNDMGRDYETIPQAHLLGNYTRM